MVLFSVIIITFLSVGAMINYNIDHKSRHAFIWTTTSKCTYIRCVSLARSSSRAKRTIAPNQPCRMTYVCKPFWGYGRSQWVYNTMWRLHVRKMEIEGERETERAYVFLYQHNTKHTYSPKVLGDITLLWGVPDYCWLGNSLFSHKRTTVTSFLLSALKNMKTVVYNKRVLPCENYYVFCSKCALAFATPRLLFNYYTKDEITCGTRRYFQ